jgi:hypothetical protein
MKRKTPVVNLRGDLDKFVDDLDDLLIHASTAKTKMESAPSSTSSSATATSLRLDSFQSKDSLNRSQLGSRNPATDFQEADISGSLSSLEKDLDFLLQSGGPEATVC